MTTIITKTIYKTKDGRSFGSEDMALAHDKLTEARDEFAEALRKYALALWETQVTADGKRFILSHRDYYYISWHWNEMGGLPRVRLVRFYYWNCELDEEDRLSIRQVNGDGSNRRIETYRIKDLYASRSEAYRYLLVAQEERLAEITGEVMKLKKEVEDGRH